MPLLFLDNSERSLEITRDDAGVPHVQAGCWNDALYGLGYMHATDRLTQILFARAVASGRAAELIADQEGLRETDRFFRRVGIHRNHQAELEHLPDHTRQELHHYCQGVNDGMQASGRSLPMWAVGFEAEHWDEEAVLLIGNLLSFGGLAVSQLENERIVIELIRSGADDDALRELFDGRLDGIDFDLIRQVNSTPHLSDEALELLADLPRLVGSNAWAVAPQKSATGSPLLASDPHLEINRLPAIWYEAVLDFGEDYVMGATLPGCPLVAVGRTSKISWGVTYMKGDTIDHFVEDCRKSDTGVWQYRREDSWHDFQVREEQIGIKGGESETMRVLENGQGTLEVDPEEHGPGYYFSLAWTGTAPRASLAIGAWLDVISCGSTKAAMDVVQHCPQPTLCWVFADVAGNIGLQGNGRFPRRHEGQWGLAPVPAWDARNHWQGFLPVDQLPSIYNPECGFVATANENVNQENGPILVSQTLPDYRQRRISEVLQAGDSLTVEAMQRLQYDLVSIQARELLPIFLPHMPEGEIKDRLAGWDFAYTRDSKETVLFQRLYRNVLLEIFGHSHGIGWRRMLYLVSRVGFSTMIIAAADAVLKKEDSLWWQNRDKGQLIHDAARKLDKEEDQPWSELNNFHFTDRFFGNNHVGRLLGYDTRKYPMPGCHATVFQGHVLQTAKRESTFAPSYHFVTDMGTNHAWTNLPGGPSESRFSRYYKSDIPLWFNGEYKMLELGEGKHWDLVEDNA